MAAYNSYEKRLEVRLSIGSQPRFRLAALPTPLHELRNLREQLGGDQRCPRILIKRDDLTGLALGGNKARKLEFLAGDARRQNASVLVTSGAAQSNHARMTTAAACAAVQPGVPGAKCPPPKSAIASCVKNNTTSAKKMRLE